MANVAWRLKAKWRNGKYIQSILFSAAASNGYGGG